MRSIWRSSTRQLLLDLRRGFQWNFSTSTRLRPDGHPGPYDVPPVRQRQEHQSAEWLPSLVLARACRYLEWFDDGDADQRRGYNNCKFEGHCLSIHCRHVARTMYVNLLAFSCTRAAIILFFVVVVVKGFNLSKLFPMWKLSRCELVYTKLCLIK